MEANNGLSGKLVFLPFGIAVTIMSCNTMIGRRNNHGKWSEDKDDPCKGSEASAFALGGENSFE